MGMLCDWCANSVGGVGLYQRKHATPLSWAVADERGFGALERVSRPNGWGANSP